VRHGELLSAMVRVERIGSLDLPALQPFATMRMQREHLDQGLFVAESEKITRRLLASPVEVVSLLVEEKWQDEFAALAGARPESITLFVAPKLMLEQLAGYPMYQGVLALGRIPNPVPLADALAAATAPRLFVAVDGLSSAENLGIVVRNAAALGAHALLVGETSAHPYIRRAVRNSMGAIFKLPVIEPASLADVLLELRRHHVRTIAAHPHVEGRLPSHADFRGDCCLVFGSEGAGLSPKVLAACDEAVAIPMQSGVDSLNVASASAALLYEVRRQRGDA